MEVKKLCQVKDLKTWNSVKKTPPTTKLNLKSSWGLQVTMPSKLTVEHAYTYIKHARPCDSHAAFAEKFGKN